MWAPLRTQAYGIVGHVYSLERGGGVDDKLVIGIRGVVLGEVLSLNLRIRVVAQCRKAA